MGRFSQTKRVRTARFPTPGKFVAGIVESIDNAPVPDFVDGRIAGPKFGADGLVVTQLDVTVITSEDEVTVLHTGTGIAIAIAQELEKIGADDLEVGDLLTVTYVGDEDSDSIPTKVYEAEIVKAGDDAEDPEASSRPRAKASKKS